MELKIQAIHFDTTEKLNLFIEKKAAKLQKNCEGIIKAEFILKVVKPETANNKQAGVKLLVRNGECFAEKINDSFEGAIDECVEALEKQLMKFKEKSRAK